MRNEQVNSPDTICSRCGASAEWSFRDTEEQIVEIVCPDCGRFEMPRAEFESSEFDMAQSDERGA